MSPAAKTARKTAGTKTSGQTVGWREVEPAPIVLVAGPEEYIATRALDRIRSQLREHEPALERTRLDASDYAAGQLEMAANPSLFGEAKLIEVSAVAAMNDEFLNDALAYAAQPAEGTVVVLHHSGGARGKKLLDAVKSNGAPVVECQPLKKDSEKIDFVTREFRDARRRIEPAAAQALVAAVGANLSELAAACSQLLSDVEGQLTADVVERYYGGRVEATAFKVADAALAGRGGQALSTLRHALATGVDPVPLVAALAMKLRTVAKVAGSRGSSGQLARELGMAPWQVDQARRDSGGWTPSALIQAIKVVAEADAQVKGAARDPVYALERAVTIISTSVSRR
ncbi:DNA polymerase III subunit delta [Arthrobacter sp. H14]|uniref:DNA polymerase III subunit delta n=1 Tax=Arthrobacter sp. H14 TaxID=1312959 RepID=UPI0004B58443|nr:DNA polymerase III subunit delta [Arthrobacter sp. H14]